MNKYLELETQHRRFLEFNSGASPGQVKDSSTIIELLDVLDEINLHACYGSEENTDAAQDMLLQIGKLARGEPCCKNNPSTHIFEKMPGTLKESCIVDQVEPGNAGVKYPQDDSEKAK